MKRKEHQVFDNVEMKYCSKCDQWKPLSEFNKQKITWDGLYGYCKICHYQHSSKWQKENPENVKINKRKFKINNPDYDKNDMANRRANDPKYRHKDRIRSATNNAITCGELIKPEACTLCHTEGPVQAHHVDYTDQDVLNPVFVCASCHAQIHAELRKKEENE